MTGVSRKDIETIRDSGLFDEKWYLERYPDVNALELDPIEHYLWIGEALKRNPSPLFNSVNYLAEYPDVANAGINAFLHYICYGRREGRVTKAVAHFERMYDMFSEPVYVHKTREYPPETTPAKIIAFYLPQYHEIPENSEWWGEGFTEWTKVKPAEPLFERHYQPHVPGELGYYNLLDSDNQRRQIELAKLYGVGGFCFYYYWFAGKRLLEKPVDNYVNDKSIDFPFCLCWANENWTRRWDGLESEILISQNHSIEDDLAFIKDITKYTRDNRYIKIDGKPLILVYRPGLLPSPKETSERWRAWCRENGVGEIYLASTRSFDVVDPRSFGFDATVEFPPNNSAPADLTQSVRLLKEDTELRAYDMGSLVQRSENYREEEYTLFRSVCPSWDNSPRRGNKGSTIFLNSSPAFYQRWLSNAIENTLERKVGDERIVFVNAWNEWGEGAHLEPDSAYGYAYLQATRNALTAAPARLTKKRTVKIAIVIHSFYLDIFDEIMQMVRSVDVPFKLFITAPEENRNELYTRLLKSGYDFRLLIVANRGRDVLPFLRIAELIKEEGIELVIKVHTKKSPHRQDGLSWRNDIYSKLMSRKAVSTAVEAFSNDRKLGMIGPENHFVAMSTYIGSNEQTILTLGRKMGLEEETIRTTGFFAGTMFAVRLSALEPLFDLYLTDDQFEPEAGQIDGTLAHAVERALALSVVAAGMRLVSTGDIKGNAKTNDRYGFA